MRILLLAAKVAATALATAILLLGSAFYYAWRWHNGPALADRLAKEFNAKRRGRMTIGSVRWTPRAALDILLGRDSTVTVRDLTLYDSKGRRVAHIPRIVARGKLWPLMVDGSFDVTSAEADTARLRLDYYPRPEGPDPTSGDTHEVGLFGALEHSDPHYHRPRVPAFYSFDRIHIRHLAVSYFHRHFQVHFRDMALEGSLHAVASTPTSPLRIRFSLQPRGGQGELRVAGKRLRLADIEAPYVRTDSGEEHDLEIAVGGKLAGARFRLSGRLRQLIGADHPTMRIHVQITRFAALLSELTGMDIGGANESLAVETTGPLSAPTTRAHLAGLAARLSGGGRSVGLSDISARLRLAGDLLHVQSLTAQGLDGTLAATGRVFLGSQRLEAKVNLDRVDLTPLLSSRTSRELLGGRLRGGLRLSGGWAPVDLRVGALDLLLARDSPTDPLPRRLRLEARGRMTPRALHIDRLSITAKDLEITARGDVGLAQRRLSLAVTAELRRLRHLLRTAGLPPIARSASLRGQLRGSFSSPRLFCRAALTDLGSRRVHVKRISGRVGFSRGVISFDQLRGSLGGGVISGKGYVRLLSDRGFRALPHPWIRASLKVSDASLTALLPQKKIAGRVTASVSLRGRPGRLAGSALVRLRRGRLAGQELLGGLARLRLRGRALLLDRLNLSWAKGGSLNIRGELGLETGKMALRGEVARLPLGALMESPALRKVISGVVSGRFHFQGHRARPIIAATVKLIRARVRGVRLGSGELQLTPDRPGSTAIRGQLFRRLRIQGRLLLDPEPMVQLTVSFRDLALHELLPELSRLPAHVTATASGQVELALSPTRGLTRLTAHLTRLSLGIRQMDHLPGETPGQVRLTNKGDLHLVFDGQRLRLIRFQLSGDAGTLSLGGWLSGKGSHLRLKGQVELGKLSFLLNRWLDDIKGRVYLKATLRGSLRSPRFEGDLILAGVRLLLPDRTEPLRIAAASLRLTSDLLTVRSARLAIHTDELSLTGKVRLRKLRPVRLDLLARGKISARILHLIVPRTFTQVSGRARASLRLTGRPSSPDLAGWIRLEPISFSLRGASRELGIKRGLLIIANRLIRIKEVRGTVDEGSFVLDGRIKLKRAWPYDMDIRVRGQGIPVKKARSYELELNTNLRLRVVDGKASLVGLVDIADGRLTETFDVVSHAFLKRRVFEQQAPFWETNSLLRSARLNITVSTNGPMLIKNNLADIRLEGNVNLRGTPLKPKLGGQIRAESGTFRIPFLRGEFTVRSGELDFDHPFGFGETYVKILGETTYTDTSDTDHDITVSLEGPLSRIKIRLDSSTGLNQSQILMLLASGRTLEQLRKQLRRKDSGPGSTTKSTNPISAYDSSLKQVTGDFLSQLVARPLQTFTRLDLVRLEMGTESFQVRVNKQLGRNLRLSGEAEFGLMGRQRQEFQVEVRILDQTSIYAKARRQIPGEDTVIHEDRYQGRLEMRYRIRLRTSLRRSLGL